MSLEEDLRNLPDSSGVYQYFDRFKKLLYIGKAKNLKRRVKSYFRFNPVLKPSPNLAPRVYKMVKEIDKIRYTLVQNEQDALVLENSLIKQLKPKYNILLRDDKTYPYISIDLEEKFPRFEITRKITRRKGVKYFGPFTSSSKEILDSIYLLFNLIQKRGCLTNKKACLFHQLGRCHAPCIGKISHERYKKIVELALVALKDRKVMIDLLKEKMERAAELENYEEAANLRDKIKAIKNSLSITSIDFANLDNLDLFCVSAEDDTAVIMRLFMRDGKVISANHTILKNSKGFEINELYKRAILQFYNSNTPILCDQILVGDDFSDREDVCRYLSSIFRKKIKITHPKIGEKAKLINISKKNAHYLLSIKPHTEDIYSSLQNLFELKETPYKIEIFDNSHLGGVATVGAMVVWNDGWQKNEYRRYNLNSTDEYSQMNEILKRRIKSFEREPKPNLWLLDGGATLLKLAKKLLYENGIDLDVLAISKEKLDAKSVRAKGRAKDVIHSIKRSYNLPTSDNRLLLLQKLRDEAHRFAISFHQKKKIKTDLSKNLMKIDGVGEATIKKLLSYFGSFDSIYNANLEELQGVVGQNLGKKIYQTTYKQL